MRVPFKLSVFASCSAWWWLLLASSVVSPVYSGPLTIEGPSSEVANNSLTDFDLPVVTRGCRYKALFYSNGEEVSTDEPCLACQCKGTVVVCKLRICPEIPEIPPPGCIVVHKAKSCCSQLVCHHGQDGPKKISREQRFPMNVTNEELLASVSNETKDSGYCVLDGTVYAEGSAMRSSTLCDHCYCLRSRMVCSSPQCIIPLNGCKPQFRAYACCPTNYDCGHSNETAVLKTVPSSTQVPQFLKGCMINNQYVPEGEPVLPIQLAGSGNYSSNDHCKTCFCMGGVVHCRPLECDRAIDGCTPIKQDGHCCPDRYDCSKPSKQKSISGTKTTTGYPVTVTEISIGDQDNEGTTTEAIIDYSKQPSYIPVAITTFGSVYDDDSTAGTTTTSSRRLGSNQEDSFERIASLIPGSSEETTSLLPSTTLRNQNQILSKKARVSTKTVGGFKNRSDLGSREERRSKDGDEVSLSPKQLLQQSTEDDERDEEYYGFAPVFDTTISNAIEDLGGATTVIEDNTVSEDSTAGPMYDDESTTYEGEMGTGDRTTVGLNYFGRQDHEEETTVSGILSDDKPTTDAIPIHSSTESVEATSEHSHSPSSLPTSTNPSSTTSSSPELEFISFVEDDALMPSENGTSTLLRLNLSNPINVDDPRETDNDPSVALLKPLELKFMNGTTEETFMAHGSDETEDAVPILVEMEEDSKPPTEFNLGNINGNPASSSSLYNNGYYPHGSIITDDEGPADELEISEGEIPSKKRGSGKVALDVIEDTVDVNNVPTTPIPDSTSTTKKAELPLKSISSSDKFIPSYAPVTVPTSTAHIDISHPSRTYSKFGLQDAGLYRYEHHNPPPAENGFQYHINNRPPTATTGLYHHRYYNEPEEVPASRLPPNPYNFYTSNTNPPVVQKNLGAQHGGMAGGMLPNIYKPNQFFYEDSSGAVDSYEEYDSYLQPPTGGGNIINSIASTPSSVRSPQFFSSSTPRIGTSSTAPYQFMGERLRLPSYNYNRQKATTTPKYRFAHKGSTSLHRPITSTERPVVAHNDYHRSKPLAPFPFSLPRGQDDNLLKNLGIKLSGCNVVGKMYSIGEIIEELSGDCLRCMCSDIGVHCAERKC